MGDSRKWLKTLKKRRTFIERLRKIFGGSILAALIVGPLIYFSVCAEQAGLPLQTGGDLLHGAGATKQVEIIEGLKDEKEYEISKRPEIRKFKEDLGPDDLEVELKDEDLKAMLKEEQEKIQDAIAYDLEDEKEKLLEEAFEEEGGVEVKSIKKELDEGLEEEMLVMQNITIDFGPKIVKKQDDAENVAQDAMRKYIKFLPEKNTISVLKDTSKLKTGGKKNQLVLSTVKHHAKKWYVTFQQYHQGLPVFDGTVKMIFTEEKRLLVLSDNIKHDLPSELEFKVGTALAKEKVKDVFNWDEEFDEVKFVDKGYYKQKPTYRISTNAHNPLGEWQVFVNGVDGEINNLYGDIRLQDEAPAKIPAKDPLPPVTEPIAETPATPEIVEPIIEAILELPATDEPELLVLDAFFGQILGKIYPQNPNQSLETMPFSDEYVYIGQTESRMTSDRGGYFENADTEWYATFLDGPYVTVHDDDATGNATLVQDNTPEDPFTWDDSVASQAAINAFYHTNKIRNYFDDNLGFEMNDKIPVTVNSHLVDQYIHGCGAWFDNTNKTIEMGRGGTEVCPTELNYALGSDFIYHEYAHFIVEDITHLPNVPGSEAAAMGEGLADYFATTINNDSAFGEVIADGRSRNLDNTLNYQYEMIGESHHDGQIIGGAFWDLRQEIGAQKTDQLILNTLYQDRLHFETFMYGMIIEDDDNNDFSDGTPHLIEIITAFENHGIGPGVDDFNGLPIDPEEWAKLLEEEVPIGEDGDGLLMSLSAGCDTTTLPGYIYVPSGNTCYVQNATHTFANGLVNGSMVIGGTISSTTLTIDTNDMTVSGSSALIIIGWTSASTGKDARLRTSGGTTSDLKIQGGGRVYTRSNTYSGIDHYITIGGTTEVGGASAGYLDIQDNYLYNTTYNLEVNTDLDIDSGRLDVSNYTYIYGSTARIDIDSGYELETNYLMLGASDGSPLGGIMNADGIIDVVYTTWVFEGGDFYCDGTCYMRSLQISGGSLGAAQLTNNGTFYLDTNGPYLVQIYDRATFTNNSGHTAYIRGGITMDEVSATTYTPTLNNYGYIYVEATSSTYYGNNDLNMYDNAVFNNGVAGTATTARFWINDEVTLWHNSIVNNYYIFYQGQRFINTSTSIFTLYDSATFNNGSTSDSSAYFINYRSTAGAEGLNYVLETSNFNNHGQTDMYRLYVGIIGGIVGGTFTNKSGGDLDINQTGTSTDCLEIFRGTLTNDSGATDLDIDGRVNIQGISGDRGYLTNNDNLAKAALVYVYDYGTLDNNASTFTIDGNGTATNADLLVYNNNGYVDNDGTLTVNDTLAMYNDSDFDNNATVNIASTVIMNSTSQINNNAGTFNANAGAIMHDTSDINNTSSATMNIGNSGTESLTMRGSSRVDNNGTFNVYDDIIMSNEISGGAASFYNSGSSATVNLTSSTTNNWYAANSATVSNTSSGVITIDSVAASSTDGVFDVVESANVSNNSATIQASVINVGTGSLDGGTYNNNVGGTTTTTFSGFAFRIYKGTASNASSATTLNVTNGGDILIYGVSGDEGRFNNYSTSAGDLSVRSYGEYRGENGASHSGTNCDVLQNNVNDGDFINNFGGAISCTTFNIGGTLTPPGVVQNIGRITATTVNIYEDSSPTSSYELYNSGWLYVGTLNLGDASHDGGELYNTGGDGTKDDATGYDGVDAGILNIYQYGNLYNGASRIGGSPSNAHAEVNWFVTPGTTQVNIEPAGTVDNYGNMAGYLINMEGSVTLGNGTFNNKTTGTGDVEAEYVQINSNGVLNNQASATVEPGISLNVLNNNATTDGVFNNAGTVTTPQIQVGTVSPTMIRGGTFENDSGGSISVTGTGTGAARIYQGTINNNASSALFNVAGQMTISGGSGLGTLNTYTGSSVTTLGELDVNGYGLVSATQTVEVDDSGAGSGNMTIDGTATYEGLVRINDGSANRFMVDGTSIIGNYGRLTNNEVATSFGGVGGFRGNDLVTVNTGGTIDSDPTSQFKFNNGILSAGTVELDDDVITVNNTTSGLSIEETAGTFTMGLPSNTGTTTGADVEISGGTFNTYNSSSLDDVLVTGSSTVANFEDSTSPINCGTDIKGYFDILAAATAEVNCSNTNDAVYVHSASPGGNTQVEGTLILNTNLETETMVVGDGASATGLVTHDLAPDNINPSDFSQVFKLLATESLTINSNGSLDVSEKSKYKNSSVTGSGAYLGGSHGGKGQYDGSGADQPYDENGEVSNKLDMMGSMGKYNSDSLGGWGGGIMNVSVGVASGDPAVEPTGTLVNNGAIKANGMDLVGAAGSGGAINLYIYNTITGSGPIEAIGGNSTGTVLTYDTSGGGGRIHMEYHDKSAFTGHVSALGGQGANNSDNAGTGTIFYFWTDRWQNQNDGTLLVDTYDYVNTSTITVDINGDGSTTALDYTLFPTATYGQDVVDVESIQLENNSLLYVTRNSEMQQCIEDSSSTYTSSSPLYMNRDHGPTNVGSNNCFVTPDPPATLYVNDTGTTAQGGKPGTKTDIKPLIPDTTPSMSGIHKDGTLDSTTIAETPTHDVYEYQLIIGSSVNNVWNDTALTNCDIDSTRFYNNNNYPHNARTNDILIPSTCGTNFSSGNTYYWKVRFMEDRDDNYATTTDQFWGLWSETNQFEITEGGSITVKGCTSGTGAINLVLDLGVPTQFDEEKCLVSVDSTTDVNITANKDQTLTDPTTSGTFIDMEAVDDYLDGKKIYSATDFVAEVAFRLDNFGGTTANMSAQTDVNQGSSLDYDTETCPSPPAGALPCWHKLQTGSSTNDTIIQALSAVIDEYFDFYLGAYIPMTDIDDSSTEAGIFTATATLTLWSNP